MRNLLAFIMSVCLMIPAPLRPICLADEGRATVVAVGDNIVHGAVYTDAKRNAATLASTSEEYVAYSFDEMYGRVADTICRADLAIINQEGPVTSRPPSGYPRFNAPTELISALARAGFDVINLANNHALDMDVGGKQGGLADTWRLVKGQGLIPIGAYASPEEKGKITTVEKNGVAIALLSYTFFTNGLSEPSGAAFGVKRWDKETVCREVTEAARISDFVIVSVHWGEEGERTPNEAQRSAAKLLAEWGADVILGHHPHVLQPIEWVDREGGGRTLVAYSLGNFLSAMLYPYHMVGGILSFTLEKETHTVENVCFIPTVCHYERAVSAATDGKTLKTRRGISVYPLCEYTEELANRHGTGLYAEISLRKIYAIVEDAIDPAFLFKHDALRTHAGK
jgi:poly-gamma-glutamate synthesis protein (capsule biosynthesis protein)